MAKRKKKSSKNLKRCFVLTVRVETFANAEVSLTEMKTHVRDAVRCWGGNLDPMDPFFKFKKVSVK